MKQLAFAFALFATPAAAGSISLQFTATAGSATKTYTVADADLNRLVAAYQQDCNTRINGTCTLNQVLTQIALAAKDAWVAKAKSHETTEAAKTIPPVADVPLN
jgi:hypothetical protein